MLKVPGAFIGTPESYVNNNLFMARFKNWIRKWGTINMPCAGRYVRGICIFGVGDLKVKCSSLSNSFKFIFCLFSFLIAPLGRDASCGASRVMPHCTSGWSLRWFHHRLVGIVGTLCG